jgi:hypothetical protein
MRQQEEHNRRQTVGTITTLAALMVIAMFATGCHSATASKADAPASASNQPATSQPAGNAPEIVLPVAEQRGAITTIIVAVQEEPDFLQFPG